MCFSTRVKVGDRNMQLILLSVYEFLENCRWKGLLFLGNKLKYIYRYKLKAFEVLEAKNTLVKSAYCATR